MHWVRDEIYFITFFINYIVWHLDNEKFYIIKELLSILKS